MRSDRADDRGERVGIRAIFVQEPAKRPEWAHRSWRRSRRIVALSSLAPSQPAVWGGCVRHAAESRAYEAKPPYVFDISGQLVVGDGHTRLAAAIVNGERAVEVVVVSCRREDVTNWTTW